MSDAISRSGEIGRRIRLKIWRSSPCVPVRVRPSANKSRPVRVFFVITDENRTKYIFTDSLSITHSLIMNSHNSMFSIFFPKYQVWELNNHTILKCKFSISKLHPKENCYYYISQIVWLSHIVWIFVYRCKNFKPCKKNFNKLIERFVYAKNKE